MVCLSETKCKSFAFTLASFSPICDVSVCKWVKCFFSSSRLSTYLNGKLIDQWHLHDETYKDANAPKITSLNIRHTYTYNQFCIFSFYFAYNHSVARVHSVSCDVVHTLTWRFFMRLQISKRAKFLQQIRKMLLMRYISWFLIVCHVKRCSFAAVPFAVHTLSLNICANCIP